MTDQTIALIEYLRKLGVEADTDFLRESVRVMSELLMEAEVAEQIWAIVAMCYVPRCIEILDWWHAVEKLWEIAFSLWSPEDQQSHTWTAEQKSLLWGGNLRQIFHGLRSLCPRGEPLPHKIRLGIGYLFHHRRRMRYPEFRQTGCPIGSGSVESACKVVVQERLKQAGMRWSRAGRPSDARLT